MILSLVVTASPWEALLERPAPTNAQRAKRGLLPRRSGPSRVTYADAAARRKGEAREFPEVSAPPVVREDPAAPGPGVRVATADRPEEAKPTAAPVLPEALEEQADRARDAEAVIAPVVTERAVDREGRILERRLGPDLEVQSVRVVGSIDDLPVLSSVRAGSGEIVERVEDRAGLLEVRRDPVGRFLSVRALPPPSEDEGD